MIEKIFIINFIIIFVINSAYADTFDYGYSKEGFKYVKHKHNESSYQHAYCSHNGIEEYQNSDFTRVDCLTDEYAVEPDFANKWAESIGQSLHYGYMTGKKAKIVLILEKPRKQMLYYYRVKNLADIYKFEVEFITPEILNPNNNRCPYSDCKCNKHI